MTLLLVSQVLGILLVTPRLNQPSISGMVAQRQLRTSYILILLITASSFYISAFNFCAFIYAAEKSENDQYFTWIRVIGFFVGFSPICSFLILLFPIVVDMDAERDGYIPQHGEAALSYAVLQRHHQLSEADPRNRTWLNLNNKFALYFCQTCCFSPDFKGRFCTRKSHTFLHSMWVFIGLVLGYAATIAAILVFEIKTKSLQTFVYIVTSLGISGICILAFVLLRTFGHSNSQQREFFFSKNAVDKVKDGRRNKILFLFEFYGLFAYQLSLILMTMHVTRFLD
jgi:hypothetical protein